MRDGEDDGCANPALGAVFDFDSAAMEFNDFARNGEAEARAFAGRFRGEKRIEYGRQFVRRDAVAVIAEFGHDHLVAGPEPRAGSGSVPAIALGEFPDATMALLLTYQVLTVLVDALLA